LALTQTDAARLLGMSRRRLHELVHGQRTMTADTALRCARHFGIPVDFWLIRQAAWDAFQAWQRQSHSDLSTASASSPVF
jgi:addiction module HigA family antidote